MASFQNIENATSEALLNWLVTAIVTRGLRPTEATHYVARFACAVTQAIRRFEFGTRLAILNEIHLKPIQINEQSCRRTNLLRTIENQLIGCRLIRNSRDHIRIIRRDVFADLLKAIRKFEDALRESTANHPLLTSGALRFVNCETAIYAVDILLLYTQRSEIAKELLQSLPPEVK